MIDFIVTCFFYYTQLVFEYLQKYSNQSNHQKKKKHYFFIQEINIYMFIQIVYTFIKCYHTNSYPINNEEEKNYVSKF